MTPSSGHLVWIVPPGSAGAGRSQPHSVRLAGHTGKSTRGLLSCTRFTSVLLSSPKAVPWDFLSELCQGRFDQRDSTLCKQPSTVPLFAVNYLETHSTKLVLGSAWIQPEAQSTGIPGSFPNPAQHKMHQAEIEWVCFWKHWLVLF